MVWNRETLERILQNPGGVTAGMSNQKLIFKMLQALNKRQTSDEQAAEITKYRNGRGFTSADARLLSSMANNSLRYGTLTEKQARYAASRLGKYVSQLLLVIAESGKPTEVKTPVTASVPMIPQQVSLNLGMEAF